MGDNKGSSERDTVPCDCVLSKGSVTAAMGDQN